MLFGKNDIGIKYFQQIKEMGKTIYRTENSSAVETKNGSLFEIRRKNLTGSQIKDPKTWKTKEEWLTEIGMTEYTSVDYNTKIHPDAQMVLGWNIPLYNTRILESTAHTLSLRAMLKRIQPIESFLQSPLERFHVGYEYFDYYKEQEGLYVYKESILTKDELLTHMINGLTNQQKQLKAAIENLLRYEFTNSKQTRVYRHQKTRDVPSILLQIYSETTTAPLIPLYINKGSGLMGYNRRVGYTFQELGLENAKVTVYEGWHSIIKPKHIGIVLTTNNVYEKSDEEE
jgi:hypothetical protein